MDICRLENQIYEYNPKLKKLDLKKRENIRFILNKQIQHSKAVVQIKPIKQIKNKIVESMNEDNKKTNDIHKDNCRFIVTKSAERERIVCSKNLNNLGTMDDSQRNISPFKLLTKQTLHQSPVKLKTRKKKSTAQTALIKSKNQEKKMKFDDDRHLKCGIDDVDADSDTSANISVKLPSIWNSLNKSYQITLDLGNIDIMKKLLQPKIKELLKICKENESNYLETVKTMCFEKNFDKIPKPDEIPKTQMVFDPISPNLEISLPNAYSSKSMAEMLHDMCPTSTYINQNFDLNIPHYQSPGYMQSGSVGEHGRNQHYVNEIMDNNIYSSDSGLNLSSRHSPAINDENVNFIQLNETVGNIYDSDCIVDLSTNNVQRAPIDLSVPNRYSIEMNEFNFDHVLKNNSSTPKMLNNQTNKDDNQSKKKTRSDNDSGGKVKQKVEILNVVTLAKSMDIYKKFDDNKDSTGNEQFVKHPNNVDQNMMISHVNEVETYNLSQAFLSNENKDLCNINDEEGESNGYKTVQNNDISKDMILLNSQELIDEILNIDDRNGDTLSLATSSVFSNEETGVVFNTMQKFDKFEEEMANLNMMNKGFADNENDIIESSENVGLTVDSLRNLEKSLTTKPVQIIKSNECFDKAEIPKIVHYNENQASLNEKLFGITCLPYLVNQCQDQHEIRDNCSVRDQLETLSDDLVNIAYRFMYNHKYLFEIYFTTFCDYYQRKGGRLKLLSMIEDCIRYVDSENFIYYIFCSLVRCGLNKENACRFIIKRCPSSLIRSSPGIIKTLMNIVLESNGHLFLSSLETYIELLQYKISIEHILIMGKLWQNHQDPELANLILKTLLNLNTEDLEKVKQSKILLSVIEYLIDKQGKLCGEN